MVRRVSRQVNACIKRCLCKQYFSDFSEYHTHKDRFAAQVNNKGWLFKRTFRSFFPSKPKHPDVFRFESGIANKEGVPLGRFLLRYCNGWGAYILEKRSICEACSRQLPPLPHSIYYESSDDDEDEDDEDDEDDDGNSSSSTTNRETNSAEEAMKPSDNDYSHPSKCSFIPSPPGSDGSDSSVNSYRSK